MAERCGELHGGLVHIVEEVEEMVVGVGYVSRKYVVEWGVVKVASWELKRGLYDGSGVT